MRSESIYDLESLIKKIDGFANNIEKSSITKIGEHVLVDVQCRLNGLLILQKISMVSNVGKIV